MIIKKIHKTHLYKKRMIRKGENIDVLEIEGEVHIVHNTKDKVVTVSEPYADLYTEDMLFLLFGPDNKLQYAPEEEIYRMIFFQKKKKILYIDMDGVIADFDHAMKTLDPTLDMGDDAPDYEARSKRVDTLCEDNRDVFHNLKPIDGGVEAVTELFSLFDVYFLSTPMYNVPESFTGKRIWIEKHFGHLAHKRLILTHRKDLAIGDFLVDDRTKNGAAEFTGTHIHFRKAGFEDWSKTLAFLKTLA